MSQTETPEAYAVPDDPLGEPPRPERPALLRVRDDVTGMRDRLGLAGWPRPLPDRLLGWLLPTLVALLAFVDRVAGVTVPRNYEKKDGSGTQWFFDEVYYAKEAHSLLQHGVEIQADGQAEYVVHPPLGKWMIALGEKAFGYNELGWRISSVVVGSLMILVFARMVRRLTRSTLLGTLGGVLLALDGMQFVQSRIATLDIFLCFWIVCTTACLVADRDHGRSRLARRVQAAADGGTRWWAGTWAGPRAGLRPWRLAAGLCLGAACSVKWSGAFFLIGVLALVFAWDTGARRTLGVRSPGLAAAWRDGLPLALTLAVVPVIVYTASWTGWFLSDNGFNRHKEGSGVVGTLQSWVDYHRQALCFHEGLADSPQPHFGGANSILCDVSAASCKDKPKSDSVCYSTATPHPYESKPFGWLVLARPVAYAYDTVKAGEDRANAAVASDHSSAVCTAVGQDCSREVLAVNTPVVWWAGLAAVLGCFFLWAARRDWRAALVLVGFATNFFPWLTNTERVAFQFYALPLLPFAVLALVLVCGVALGGPGGSERRRTVGAVGVGLFTLLALGDFAWLHPVLAGDVIPYSAWRARVTDLGFPGWL